MAGGIKARDRLIWFVATLLFTSVLADSQAICSAGADECGADGNVMLQVAAKTDHLNGMLAKAVVTHDSSIASRMTSFGKDLLAAMSGQSTKTADLQPNPPKEPSEKQQEEAGKAMEEPGQAPGWMLNLGCFAAFCSIILGAMMLTLVLMQLLDDFIQRWQTRYLAALDAPRAAEKKAAAAVEKTPTEASKRGRSVEDVAAELNGQEIWKRLNGDHARLSMLLDIANSKTPQDVVQTLVDKAAKIYKIKLSKQGMAQATAGLMALALSVKALQSKSSSNLPPKERFRHVVKRIMTMNSVCRAFGMPLHKQLHEKTDTHCENHGEHLANRYADGEPKSGAKSFQDARLSQSLVASYFASQKWLDHSAIGFVFLYSQACAFGYAMYLKHRFPNMYAFMGPWLLVSRGEAMAVVVLTTLMVFLLTRSLMTAVRPYMAWSSVFQTIADKHVFIHKWIGKMLVFCAVLHTCGHIFGSIPAIIGETDSSKINKAFTYGTKITFNFNSWAGALKSWPAITGILLLLILICFWALSIEYVRKKSFEAFHYPHLVLICLWCGTLVAHGAKQWLGIGVPLASVSVLPMVLIYAFLRYKDIRNGSHDSIRISEATIKKSSVLLEIDTGSAGYAYDTGMYCMLNVPEISELEWHPFTIASGGGNQKFKVLFATVGDWTNKLKELLVEATKNSKSFPKIRVRGGYGAPAEGMKDQKHIILVGGGVGATPFLSFLSNITNSAKPGSFDQFAGMESAVFFWLSRDPDDFILVNEYNTIINDTPSLKGRVQIKLCLTKALDTSKDSGGAELALLWMGVEIAMTKFESKELEKELGIPTQFGRPKWPEEFSTYCKELKKKFGEKLDVSVFACGAKVLTDSLEEACEAVSDGEMKLQLFAEEF